MNLTPDVQPWCISSDWVEQSPLGLALGHHFGIFTANMEFSPYWYWTAVGRDGRLTEPNYLMVYRKRGLAATP